MTIFIFAITNLRSYVENRTITCIECPLGCRLSVDVEGCRVVKVSGNKCPKGEDYAVTETERPMRMLTSTVITEGLPLRAVPVRTDRPVPKEKILDIMAEIKTIRLRKKVRVGEVLLENALGLGVNIIATREVE